MLCMLALAGHDTFADAPDTQQYRVDILREKLKDLLAVTRDFQQKVFAGFMIGIGWLITSESARSYLAQRSRIRYAMLFCIAAVFAVVLLTFVDYYQISEALFAQLQEAENVFESEADLGVSTYRFRRIHLVFTAAFNTLLWGFFSMLVYSQKTK
jgi:hypothetical protein